MFVKMAFIFASILAVFMVQHLTFAKPLVTDVDPELTAGYYEGDMLLTPEQLNVISRPSQARNGLIDESKRWPGGIVYYKIVGDFDVSHRNSIQNAISVLESRTCLRFHKANNDQTNYVAIGSKSGGCFTAVGYQAKTQEMNLENYPIGEGCFRHGTILHEFMHALGFYHEQSAADRDDFIKVKYENIAPGKEFNFKKYGSDFVTNFDVGYDYDSCLHYRAAAFSINGEDTIVPLNLNAKIGQRDRLSKKDIDKINTMYKCPIKI